MHYVPHRISSKQNLTSLRQCHLIGFVSILSSAGARNQGNVVAADELAEAQHPVSDNDPVDKQRPFMNFSAVFLPTIILLTQFEQATRSSQRSCLSEKPKTLFGQLPARIYYSIKSLAKQYCNFFCKETSTMLKT